MVGKGLEQNSGRVDLINAVTSREQLSLPHSICSSLALLPPLAITSPPHHSINARRIKRFLSRRGHRLLITLHCSRRVLTNKLPIQTRVRHLEVVNGSLVKSVESCEGRIVSASRESRVNLREEKEKKERKKETSWLENLCVYGESTYTR